MFQNTRTFAKIWLQTHLLLEISSLWEECYILKVMYYALQDDYYLVIKRYIVIITVKEFCALWVYKIPKSQHAMRQDESKAVFFLYFQRWHFGDVRFPPKQQRYVPITCISFVIKLPSAVTFHLPTSELRHTGPTPPGQTTIDTVPQVTHWLTKQSKRVCYVWK